MTPTSQTLSPHPMNRRLSPSGPFLLAVGFTADAMPARRGADVDRAMALRAEENDA
jgi:hypothetical protein